MPRMRLLKEAFNEIKQHDPDTALTIHGLRRLVLTGQIPHCRIGNKILIDIDNLENYLSNPTPLPEKVTYGVIRPVKLK